MKFKAIFEFLVEISNRRLSSSKNCRDNVWALTKEGEISRLSEILSVARKSDLYENYLNITSTAGVSPLALAISRGHTEVVEFLISSGANPRVQNLSQTSALHLALHSGSLPVVSLLLSSGTLLHVRDSEGVIFLYRRIFFLYKFS
jgi:ankyrin repeat protein